VRALGTHLIVELHNCHPELLKDLDFVKDTMISAAQACRATVVDAVFHEFNPFGVSGIVVIAESHLSIHTWPEYHYAAVDIFTCGDTVKPVEAAEYIAARLRCENRSFVEFKRGVISGIASRLHKYRQTARSERKAADAHHELSMVY